jgi:hypothetical protein
VPFCRDPRSAGTLLSEYSAEVKRIRAPLKHTTHNAPSNKHGHTIGISVIRTAARSYKQTLARSAGSRARAAGSPPPGQECMCLCRKGGTCAKHKNEQRARKPKATERTRPRAIGARTSTAAASHNNITTTAKQHRSNTIAGTL